MRADRHFFNMVEIISHEEKRGKDINNYSYILHLYQKSRDISKVFHKICNGTNISNNDKQFFFVEQDWEKEIKTIRGCHYLQQGTRESIERAYKNISLFVKEAEKEENEYMNSPNTFTKKGRKVLRQSAFEFGDATKAICYEIENICEQYPEEEIKSKLKDFSTRHIAPKTSVKNMK